MQKTSRKQLRVLRRRRLALALVGAMAMSMMPALAQNLPSGGTVVNGSATIGSTTTQTTITQTTKGAIIDWGGFNIGSGYGVTFDQQFGSSSVTLNRVVGTPGVSSINGTLTANGSVFIINPAGITFGSGAQVNVGGLVASTLAISNADFLAGLTSGQYRFSASGSTAGAIFNSGQLTAADGGTIGLIGSYINNTGTIIANLGSVVFGATSQVTLDFYGDGLTQVTVSGNGLGQSNCTLNCTGGINSSGSVFAQGGHIEMRSNTMDGQSAGNALFVDPANGGRVWISGNVGARTAGTRRGSIIIDAGQGNIDLGGVQGKTANVSANAINAGEQAGTVQLRGNQLFTYLCVWTNGSCQNNNQLGFINASTYGSGGLGGGTITIDVGRLYHAGVIQASSATGAGGTVSINANSAEIYNLVFAEGYGGPGGSINVTSNSLLLHRGITPWIDGGPNYSLATLSAFGSTSGGTVDIDAASLSMVDLGTVSPDDVNLDPAYRPTINVNGYGGNGGTINVNTSSFNLSSWQYFEATGTQAGGNIAITANSIDLAGGLVASGATGGRVTTTTTGTLFAAATAYIKAGAWLVHAPSVDIVPAAGAVPGPGAVLTDDALSSSLDDGTAIELFADGALAPGASGSIRIGGGVDIVHATSNAAALNLRATAGIYGANFSIASSGGPLDLSFTANVARNNPDDGYVSFYAITLDSNGGDIDMNADGRGVYLEYSQVSSGAGDITIFGSGMDNGVLVQQTSLTSSAGDISVTGAATAVDAIGVNVRDGAFTSTSGDITIAGSAPSGTGVSFGTTGQGPGSSVTTSSGAISVISTGLSGLNAADVPFTTDTGDITLQGTALGDDVGVYVGAGGLTTNGGDITIIGSSTAYTGVWVYGGDIASNGGDITITGSSADRLGVQLSASAIDSAGGDIGINGLAGSAAGFSMDVGSRIDAGAGLVALAAGNAGASDAIVLDGTISSNTAINLRPSDTGSAILLGAGNGFSLTNAELARIDAPLLIIGSAQHAGAIQVLETIDLDADLTLQNQGGSGGIDLQAGLDVGVNTLALASGGSISQSAAGAITARSLLALAGGNVLLGAAQNDVAATTLAGSSGGDFEFLDATALAIGSVSASGFNASGGQLSGLAASGITAGGDALVRNLAGDLVLQSGIAAGAIDLVTAGTLQNASGATLTAANGWRVWATTWVGETRGGLAGNGALPNLYGCTFNGACAANAPVAGGNYFIYRQQPTAVIAIGNATREYGLANPAFTFSVTGAVLGDGQGSVAVGAPTTAATIGSNVGTYAISGAFTSPAGYALQFSPGSLSVTPATLVFTADEWLRYFGFANPAFTGTFSGFRNGDTLQSVFGSGVSITSPAGASSVMGYYPIYASGTALNYVIQQAPGNEVALQIVPAPQFAAALNQFISDPQANYVYESNFSRNSMCPLGAPSGDEQLQVSGSDDLGRDWLKVRRLQLNNCIETNKAPGCRF